MAEDPACPDADPEYTEEFLAGLFPKWNCPVCGDWFHMPYKYCQCDRGKG